MTNEYTSPAVAQIASKALKGEPLRPDEIKSLAASALTQAPDKVIETDGGEYQRGRLEMAKEIHAMLQHDLI